MQPQCVQQAHCTECDDEENEFRITEDDLDLMEDTITYEIRCQCGAEATVQLTLDGIDEPDLISYEGASWNQDDGEEAEA